MKNPISQRVNGWRFTFAQFNSQELTRITGMPGPLQRVWRSRGQLQGAAGPPPTFDAREVAENLVRYELSRLGVSPSEAGEEGCLAAQNMLWYALLNHDGACEVLGTPEATTHFLNEFERDAKVVSALTGEPDVKRFVLKLSGDHVKLVPDVCSFLNTYEPIGVTLIDLERAANQLAVRAARPLFSVDVSYDSTGPRVRRLTGQRPHRPILVDAVAD